MTTYLDVQTAGSHLYPIQRRDSVFLVRLYKAIKSIVREAQENQMKRELGKLSDRMLRDIGLDRSDLF